MGAFDEGLECAHPNMRGKNIVGSPGCCRGMQVRVLLLRLYSRSCASDAKRLGRECEAGETVALEPIQFRASFPAIQTAIKITGDGGGMRIQLDIPESEMAQAVKLLMLRQVVLRVTVEQDEPKETGSGTRTPQRSAAKRRE